MSTRTEKSWEVTFSKRFIEKFSKSRKRNLFNAYLINVANGIGRYFHVALLRLSVYTYYDLGQLTVLLSNLIFLRKIMSRNSNFVKCMLIHLFHIRIYKTGNTWKLLIVPSISDWRRQCRLFEMTNVQYFLESWYYYGDKYWFHFKEISLLF